MRDGIWYKDEIGDCEDSDMKKMKDALVFINSILKKVLK